MKHMVEIKAVSESAESQTGSTSIKIDNGSNVELLNLYCNIVRHVAKSLCDVTGISPEKSASKVFLHTVNVLAIFEKNSQKEGTAHE
jgi:hypothetical protein